MIVEPYDGILNDVLNDRFFGLIECDIETPEHLKNYFAEIFPIFKNVEITYNNVYEETKEQAKPNYKSRKLVGNYLVKRCYSIQTCSNGIYKRAW
jgi:hypothetical protein